MTAATAREVRLSRHCVDRFHARFRPGADEARAEAELRAMLPCAQLVHEAPAWLAERRREADAYLVIGDDLAMPLVPVSGGREYLAVTCLSRGTISPSERARRKARRDGRRRRFGR